MKIFNIFKKIILIYWFLFLLIILSILRFYFYEFPSTKEENFQTYFVITHPITNQSSQKILKNSSYTVKTYVLDYCLNDECTRNLELGDILNVEGTRYYNTIYADKIEYYKESPIKPLYRLKGMFINASSALLLEPYSSLLNGILFGLTPDISDDYENKLINTGVIHVVVVSGYNISILYLFISKILGKYSLKTQFFIGFLISLLYCSIVGFEPPVMRALLMGTIAGFGISTGKVKDTVYLLFISTLFMVIYKPTLINSVSLKLTFFATLGILVLNNPLEFFVKKTTIRNYLPNFFTQDFVTSFTAQLFVFPILLYYFNSVSLLGLVVNPLILWVIPIIMLVGFIFLFLYIMGLYPLIKPILYVLQSPIQLFDDFVHFMSSGYIPNVSLSINNMTLIAVYLSIAVFSTLIIKLKTRMEVSDG